MTRHRRGRKPIESVAIIGAGLMGIEIAAANVRHGLRVLMTDTNPQTLAAAPERIAAELAKYERRGGASGTECSQAEPGNKSNAMICWNLPPMKIGSAVAI